MATVKTVVGPTDVDEAWSSALRESGFTFKPTNNAEEALTTSADLVLIDARNPQWNQEVQKLKDKIRAPIFSIVRKEFHQDELAELRGVGVTGYLAEGLPAEEVVIRFRAHFDEQQDQGDSLKEARAAQRIWFQQKVDFQVFDRSHSAWSTTLSQTGIFLRTPLTFPLYTVIRMKFDLFAGKNPFESDGVIVRQEVEGPIRGLGIMFQNLKGENVALLESFLELHR